MVELRFNVSEVDYASVFQALAGGMAGPAAMMARALPDSAKEEMAVSYINANAARLEDWLAGALAAKGVRMKISGARAAVVRR